MANHTDDYQANWDELNVKVSKVSKKKRAKRTKDQDLTDDDDMWQDEEMPLTDSDETPISEIPTNIETSTTSAELMAGDPGGDAVDEIL